MTPSETYRILAQLAAVEAERDEALRLLAEAQALLVRYERLAVAA